MAKKRGRPKTKVETEVKHEDQELKISDEDLSETIVGEPEVVEQLTKEPPEPEKHYHTDEAARILQIQEDAVKLYIDHNRLILRDFNGVKRITHRSLMQCKQWLDTFKTKKT